jgi:hypothetical protein
LQASRYPVTCQSCRSSLMSSPQRGPALMFASLRAEHYAQAPAINVLSDQCPCKCAVIGLIVATSGFSVHL